MNSSHLFSILILLLGIIYPVQGTACRQVSLPESETALKALLSEISPGHSDENNLAASDSFANQLAAALIIPGAFEYPFDQLKTMGKITSSDKKIRLITWNIPLKDGTHVYYGFLMSRVSGKEPQVFRLTDNSDNFTHATTETGSPANWYGCLVYEIVEMKSAGETLYTLLGYDPNNLFTSKKLMDVLWFNPVGEPVFGKPVFRLSNGIQSRVLFEYSAKVQMSLKWNEGMKMIVFDHLSPSRPSFTGQYEHYGPDFSYDGFRFEKDSWMLVENIDVRNE
ncbi:MAG: hypothetical protein JXQ80_01545 [Bacteroidales bacterium]|nr:hypothetical protein [Bacteroidales bacterium]